MHVKIISYKKYQITREIFIMSVLNKILKELEV
jgi:hypothetical protein